MPKTLFEKIWETHEVAPGLIYIDLHMVHEVTSAQAFESLRLAGRAVRRPDRTLATADHNVTHGAFGALAFGIGTSEVEHVLATQTLVQPKPKAMRVRYTGELGFGVTAKDLILGTIGQEGVDGAVGHVVEYAGLPIEALSMEGRMTVCNMTIEGGGRAGMVAPDDTTFAWVEGRPGAPRGADFERALDEWRVLRTDDGARFDKEIVVDAAALSPQG